MLFKSNSSLSRLKLNSDRLNAFSDGVIAIVITILVLGIDIPEDHNFNQEGLINFFIKLEPGLIAYVTSFLLVGVYWSLHNAIFDYVKYSNRSLIWLNILFLLALTLLPFVSKVKTIYRYDILVIVIFACTHIICGLLLYFIWKYICNNKELTDSEIDNQVKRKMNLHVLVTPIICALAIGLSFLNIHLGTYSFILVLPIYLFLGEFGQTKNHKAKPE